MGRRLREDHRRACGIDVQSGALIVARLARLARGARVLEDAEVQSASGSRDDAVARLANDSPRLYAGDTIVNDDDSLRVHTEMVPMTEVYDTLRIHEFLYVSLETRIFTGGLEIYDPATSQRYPGPLGFPWDDKTLLFDDAGGVNGHGERSRRSFDAVCSAA